MGHVAGIGDVIVGANEWIAGPNTPSRIEGISIEWLDKPNGLELTYAVKTASQATPPKLVHLGTFAGTRGRALAVTGMVIEMTGAKAASCQLIAEALFLSAPLLRATGQRLVLSGPSGRETLVGFPLSI